MKTTDPNEPADEMERKCNAIRQILLDGDDTLAEALKLYDVPEEVYTAYMAKQITKKYTTAWNHQVKRKSF